MPFGLHPVVARRTSAGLDAEEVLFFGNSFTAINILGVPLVSVPRLTEGVASSKGKILATAAVTKWGRGWDYHLAKPATDFALRSRPWNWVVIQGYSLNATHAAKDKAPDRFSKRGEEFHDRIAKFTLHAGVILYETWAYGARHPIFKRGGDGRSSAEFSGPEEMHGEIKRNYAALKKILEKKDAKRPVRLAPVGSAFARCGREHPEIDLYAGDFKHQSRDGSYLVACVFHGTIFQDSPRGAAPAKGQDPERAAILQAVAEETLRVSEAER